MRHEADRLEIAFVEILQHLPKYINWGEHIDEDQDKLILARHVVLVLSQQVVLLLTLESSLEV